MASRQLNIDKILSDNRFSGELKSLITDINRRFYSVVEWTRLSTVFSVLTATTATITTETVTTANITKLVLATPTLLTIATGAITVTQSYHKIEGEGAAADELATINGMTEGQILLIRCNSANDITIKHNTGNIRCHGLADFVLTDVSDMAMFIHDGTGVRSLALANNLA